MAHEEIILKLMEELRIASVHDIGNYMAHRGIWTAGTSAANNADKTCKNLVGYNRLEKGDGYYRIKGCESEYKPHARKLTESLIDILKLNFQTKIFREHSIEEKGLRPDAIVFLTHNGQGLCFFLEVCNNETPEYLQAKINTIKNWPEAKEYLSNLFKTKINDFDIVVAGDLTSDDAIAFNTFIEEVKK